jgi:Aldehyde dehydrogenase family
MSTRPAFTPPCTAPAMQRASRDDGGMLAVPALEPADSRYYSLVGRLLQRRQPRSCPAEPQRIWPIGVTSAESIRERTSRKVGLRGGRCRQASHALPRPAWSRQDHARRAGSGSTSRFDEAVSLANSSPYGLGGHVYCSDPKRARWVADQLETGMIAVNGGRNPTPRLRSAV